MNGADAYGPRRGPRAPFLRLAGIGLVVLVSAIVIVTAPLLLRGSSPKEVDSATAPTAAISPATMTTTAFADHVSSSWEEGAATTFAYNPVESAEESHYHPTALKAKGPGSTHYHSERRGSESRSSSSEGKGSKGKGPSSSSSEGRVSSQSSKGKGSSSSERTAPSAASQGEGPTSGKGGTIYHGHHASPVAPPSPVRLVTVWRDSSRCLTLFFSSSTTGRRMRTCEQRRLLPPPPRTPRSAIQQLQSRREWFQGQLV